MDLSVVKSRELTFLIPREWGRFPAIPGILVALGTTPDVWEHSLMIISRPRLEKLAGTDGLPHPPAHARR